MKLDNLASSLLATFAEKVGQILPDSVKSCVAACMDVGMSNPDDGAGGPYSIDE